MFFFDSFNFCVVSFFVIDFQSLLSFTYLYLIYVSFFLPFGHWPRCGLWHCTLLSPSEQCKNAHTDWLWAVFIFIVFSRLKVYSFMSFVWWFSRLQYYGNHVSGFAGLQVSHVYSNLIWVVLFVVDFQSLLVMSTCHNVCERSRK